MNDQHIPPHDDDDPAERRDDVEHALMRRALSHVERDYTKPRRPIAPTVIGLLLAVSVVSVVGLGFDAFLSGIQRLLARIAAEDAAIEAKEPLPVFVVPEDGGEGREGREGAEAKEEREGEEGKEPEEGR